MPAQNRGRARIEQEETEELRLFGLTDAWLAAAILSIARKAQASTPEHTPGQCTYNARLIWGIVPEIARRMGVVRMTTDEIDWEVRELSDYELRIRLGHTLANIGHCSLPGWDMLSREVANGNPLVFAIDRLCRGKMGDAEDPLVRRLTEIARVRKRPFNGVWTPSMYCDEENEVHGKAHDDEPDEWEGPRG